MAVNTNACPECQSEDLSSANGVMYTCGGCDATLVKHRRRSRGIFGSESTYFMAVKRDSLEEVVQQPKSGKPHIIDTEG